MRPIRPKLTVLRAMLAMAIVAILCFIATDPIKRRAQDRRRRLLEIAANHAANAREYARNAAGSPAMLRLAAWHARMRREFERAADRPDAPAPASRPFPPEGWTPSDEGTAED